MNRQRKDKRGKICSEYYICCDFLSTIYLLTVYLFTFTHLVIYLFFLFIFSLYIYVYLIFYLFCISIFDQNNKFYLYFKHWTDEFTDEF